MVRQSIGVVITNVEQLEREQGQDLIEYALLAALIAIAAIVVIILVGPELRNLFQDVVNALQRTS